MKISGIAILLLINIAVVGQGVNQAQSIKTIDRVFDNYIKQKENTDSKANRTEMELSLKFLQTECDVKYFSRLIDVWMYYDPTDFPTRKLINPILLLHKEEGLKAINERLKRRKKREKPDTAPYSDLLSLRNDFKIQ